MDDKERLALAQAWMSHTRDFRKTGQAAGEWWAAEKMWDLERDDPETLWQMVLLIHSLDDQQEPAIVENLSAGPLEMLLTKHGSTYIDKVEEMAGKDPKFAFLLGGVWQNAMTDDIWARVQQAWERCGWDGHGDGPRPRAKV